VPETGQPFVVACPEAPIKRFDNASTDVIERENGI